MRRHNGPRVQMAAALIAALAVLLCAGCGGTSAARAPVTTATPAATAPRTAPTVPAAAHVVVVVMENKSVDDVMGSAPYLQHLAGMGASFTDWHAVAHPSQPNYIAMFSGSPHGVTTDDCPQRLSGPNLGRELIDAGRTFAGYSEGMPRTGYTGCRTGRYARKHNPWVDFGDVPASANRTFAAFPSDFSRLPTVSFVIPNLCDDMHDCDVRTGDIWLREHLDGYARWALRHDSVLVVTWDENDGSSGNRIPTVLVGQRVRPGTYGAYATHYTLLRTIEDMYDLPLLGAGAATGPITGVWRT